MRKRPSSSQMIAAAFTALFTLLLLLMLYFGSMNFDRAALAEAPIAEPDVETEEDVFLDPPLVIGSDDASDNISTEAEASPLGEPEKAPVENNNIVTPGENKKPDVKSTEKLITNRQPSSLKTEEPKVTEKPESKITSTMASRFSGKNGKNDGKQGMSGSGGKGEGVKGNVRGRKFLGCPLPKVALREKVTVVVSIRVDDKGKVIEASYKSGSAASSEIRNKCVTAARSARWSEQPGAAPVAGTITFTIVPKK